MKVSDYVASLIAATGVKHVFTVSGAGNLHILDSIESHAGLELICNLHEQASAMCMEAYSRATDGFGICVVTFGPGSTNAVTGVAGAWMDSIPCLTISGQAKLADTVQGRPLRQRGIQEVDIVSIVKSITKYSIQVTTKESIRYHFEKAIYLAKTGRPGPVWIDIPMDIEAQQIDPDKIPGFDSQVEFPTAAPRAEYRAKLKSLVEALKNAQRPALLVGHGVRLAGGIAELYRLIEALGAPVLTAWNGADLIGSDHPSYVGRPGTYGQRGANFALQNCDFLLSIGARLSIPQTGYEMSEFCRAAKRAVVDIDQAELDKISPPHDFSFAMDAKIFMDDLVSAAHGAEFSWNKDWLQRCKEWRDKFPACLPEYYDVKGAINSYAFVEQLSEHLTSRDVVVTDMGTSFTCVHQTLRIKRGQRFFTSSGLAAMGSGLPAAIGASFARGKARVVCLVGDGGVQMNLQELALLRAHELPVKLFVINNFGYLSIKQTQDAMFKGRHVASSTEAGVIYPSIVAIAEAYEISSATMRSIPEFNKTMRETFDLPGPYIYEIIMPTDQALVPKSSVEIKPDGRIVSRPLEDLYPFLDRKEFHANMIVPPLPASE